MEKSMYPTNNSASDSSVSVDVGKVFVSNAKTGPRVLTSNKPITFHVWNKPTVDYHAHENYYEVIIMTKGSYIHVIDGEKIIMSAGDAVLIHPGQFHVHRKQGNIDTSHINLTCSLSFVSKLLGADFNPSSARQIIHLDEKNYSLVLSFQDVILKSTHSFYSDILLESFISIMLGNFYVPKSHSEMPNWLQDFIYKLHNLSFDTEFSLSDIYALSNYSRTVLSKEFKKYTGKTIVQYINDLKLTHACNLLKSTNMSVLDISAHSGFDSYVHFARKFKDAYGYTPSEFRKHTD